MVELHLGSDGLTLRRRLIDPEDLEKARRILRAEGRLGDEAPAGNGLRTLRRQAGLSVHALERLIPPGERVDSRTISRIEGGEVRAPRLDTCRAIAGALSRALGRHVTIDELFA